MKQYYKLILLSLICPFLSVTILAQQIIRGKIMNADSKQLVEDATIFNSNNATATNTDAYGRFQILSTDSSVTVLVSSVGFTTKTVQLLPGKMNIITLTPSTASLKEITLTAATSASRFSTLSKIDLSLRPVRSSQELLRLAPGLFVAQHAGGGKAEQIFLRGFDVDHGTDVSVNVDGMPVNMVSHAHGQGYADAHFIIAETVSNIDFGAGPYYANYGNFTTAGYINMATFDNIDKSRIQVEAGRFNSYRTLVMLDLLKKNKAKQSAYLAADYNYSDGPTENPQHFKRFNIFGKYNLAINDRSQFSASVSAFKSSWDASGQVPERAVEQGLITRFGSLDPTEGGNTERYNLNAVINTQLNNKWQWENQLYYSRYLFNLYSNFTFFANDPVNGDGIQQEEKRNLLGFRSALVKKSFAGAWKIKSTFSAGVRYDATNNSELNAQVKRQFLSNIKKGDINETNAFAFIQKQINNNRWAFDAAIRVDYFNAAYNDKLSAEQLPSRDAAIVSPKLKIQYTASKFLQLYVKTGKGFHSNDSRVVVANDGKEILPAAVGSDIGIVLKPGNHLYINIAAWYLHLEQEFVYVGDAGIVEPSGATRRQGLDLLLRYQFNKKLFANVNLNYTHARAAGEAKGENYIPLAPDLTSTGALFYKASNGFNGGLSYRYIKNRPANEDNSIIAKGYFLLDVALNYTKAKYEIGVSVENMLNVEWNEAQFATESRLRNETAPVNELHFTPGAPFFAKAKLVFFF